MPRWRFQLAQINIAKALAPLNDPSMTGFTSQMEMLNHLAEQTTGFVWRLQGADGLGSAYVRAYEDERIIVNMSVWESLEALQHYVYRTDHRRAFRDRRKWFEPIVQPAVALWWIPAGNTPTVAEGKERLEALQRDGPSPYAFTFRHPFPPPEVGKNGGEGPYAS